MKPLYLVLIFIALLITGLADALELGFATIIPGVGLMIGIPLAVCINITMGSGLVLLLVNNGMFHPRFGPMGIVAGAIPGLDSLPIWLALVIAGVIHKMAEEESGIMGSVAKIASSANKFSLANPSATLKSLNTARQTAQGISSRSATSNLNTKPLSRSPIGLKSPSLHGDIKPSTQPRAANDNRPYVQKAA